MASAVVAISVDRRSVGRDNGALRWPSTQPQKPNNDAGWSSLVARRAHNPKVAGLYPPLMRDSDRCTNERRLRSIPSWKRFVIKLLPSCYPGVTPCVHNVGYQKPRCSSPFPFITLGGTGLSGLREDHQAGTPRTTIHSARDAALAGLLLLAGLAIGI
jgi:hypothetical protein